MNYNQSDIHPKMKFMVKGEGATRPTGLSLVYETKGDNKMKTLGGLITKATPGVKGVPKPEMSAKGINTDRCIVGKNATAVSGEHFGQIPFAGAYMKQLGKRL